MSNRWFQYYLDKNDNLQLKLIPDEAVYKSGEQMEKTVKGLLDRQNDIEWLSRQQDIPRQQHIQAAADGKQELKDLEAAISLLKDYPNQYALLRDRADGLVLNIMWWEIAAGLRPYPANEDDI